MAHLGHCIYYRSKYKMADPVNNYYDQDQINSSLENTLGLDPMNNNQKIKKGRGGARKNAGRKKGSIQKLGGADLLHAIEMTTGRSFADNIADHYYKAILRNDWHDVRDYEKFIVNKVISDTKEIDVTSKGEKLTAVFNFPTVELPDWKE